MFKQNKLLILLGAGIVAAAVIWYSFMRDKTPAPLLQTQDLTAGNAIESDVVTVLLQLQAVSLSGTIFSDPAFISLQDFGREIVPEPVGRPNPFAPLGRNVTSTSTTGRTSQ